MCNPPGPIHFNGGPLREETLKRIAPQRAVAHCGKLPAGYCRKRVQAAGAKAHTAGKRAENGRRFLGHPLATFSAGKGPRLISLTAFTQRPHYRRRPGIMEAHFIPGKKSNARKFLAARKED